MKIKAIADIHGFLPEIEECDVLCIAGDVVGLNDQRNLVKSKHWFYNRFKDWVIGLPCSKVILVPGNHDFWLEWVYTNEYKQVQEELYDLTNGKLILLIDEAYVYEGFKFFGTPWIEPIPFQENIWAFSDNISLYPNTVFDVIQEDVDVLISHDNPFNNPKLYANRQDPLLHIYGHWHDGFSDEEYNMYNVAIRDDMYNIKKLKDLQLTFEIMKKDKELKDELKEIEIATTEKVTDVLVDTVEAEFLEEVLEEPADEMTTHFLMAA